MPGNIQAAVVSPASTVLPFNLCTQLVETHSFPQLTQQYHDGTYERSLITDGVNAPQDLHTWQFSQRLTPAQISTLQVFFFVTVQGGLYPFFYYNPLDVLPGQAIGSNWDPTGANTQGRYTVYFRGNWRVEITVGRSNIPGLVLVEVA